MSLPEAPYSNSRPGLLMTGFASVGFLLRWRRRSCCLLLGSAKLARCRDIMSPRFTFIVHSCGSSFNSTECAFRRWSIGLSYPQSASSGRNARGGKHLRISSRLIPPTIPASQHDAKSLDAIALRWFPGGIRFAPVREARV